jgi:sugar (pentulose or hexulose) kinase
MENTVIGIDLSTTTAKAIAWDRTGRAIAEGRAPLTLERPEPNVYEQHPDAWWRAVQTALTGVLAQVPAESVAAIAIANQRETVAVTDAEDTPLRPAILWLDERRKAEVAALSAKVGADRLHALTGKPLDWAPAVYSLAWLAQAEPDLFARIVHVYDPHAWIVRRLTGEFATSWASADPLGAFDIVDHQWADPVIQALPLASEKFPTASAPGTIIGQVIPSAAAMTGLRASTPVVSGGG